MERQEILERLSRLIREKIAPHRTFEVSVGVTLNELGLDSLDRVELIMMVEEEFSICISDEAADAIKTVGDAVVVIQHALEEPTE